MNVDFQLADHSATPPTPSSYWVLPSRLLAGAYPGHQDPAKHQARIHGIVDAGIGLFVNLMEENETNYAGQAFVTYADVAGQHSPGTRMSRHAIRDESVPSRVTEADSANRFDASASSPYADPVSSKRPFAPLEALTLAKHAKFQTKDTKPKSETVSVSVSVSVYCTSAIWRASILQSVRKVRKRLRLRLDT